MAIIIPSKDIYEINNQKVVDNEVDNVEVDAKRIEEIRDYSVNVYNNDFDVVTYQQGAETSDIHEEYRLHSQSPTSYCAVSGVFKPFYVDIDVVVNKQIGNKIITQIKTGEDKTDETANIKYTTACIKKSAPISATYNTSESGRHDPSFTNIQYTYPDDGEEGVFNLPKTITVQHNYSDISLSEITVNLNDETNLKDIGGTIKITETNDYFSFTCHLLCGEEIYELKGDAVGPPTNRSTASGTATIYIPQKISLTVYGNTIGIDLQDETVKIGDGQHVYSFSGNELMQTSNKKTTSCLISVGDFVRSDGDSWSVYSVVQSRPAIHSGDVLIYNGEKAYCISTSPAQISVQNNGEWAKMSNVHISFTSYKEEGSQIENYYKNVISQWQNGKEIATIKCGMVDYYQSAKQTNSIQVYKVGNISSKRCSISGTLTSAMPNKNSLIGVYMTISGNTYKMYNISLANNNTDITGEIDLSYRDVALQLYNLSYEYMETTPAISVKEAKLPMTFHIGDIVIPYIKGADGQDKPISYYMDRTTPKEFLVIGKGITADGEILQELTLQEVTQNK